MMPLTSLRHGLSSCRTSLLMHLVCWPVQGAWKWGRGMVKAKAEQVDELVDAPDVPDSKTA